MSIEQFGKFWTKQKHWLRSIVLGSAATILTANSGLGADKISLQYGLLEFSLPISSLELYARAGKIDRHLAFYAKRLESKNLAKLKTTLDRKIPIDLTTVSGFFYSSSGEAALEFLGKFIKPGYKQNGLYALRSAVILAAADNQGLTLLNVLKKFPTQTINIDLGLILKAVNTFTKLAKDTNLAVAAIESKTGIEVKQHSLKSNRAIDLSQVGNLTWEKQTLILQDKARNRKFYADIYRPHRQGKIPLLVIYKGFGARRSDFSDLAQHLASYGFAVAILERPSSNSQQLEFGKAAITNTIEPNEFIDSPLDVSFLLDRLQQLNSSSFSLQGQIDTKSVGVLGHSFGGYTALALAGAELNLASLRQECHSNDTNGNVVNPSMLLQCLAAKLPTNSIPRLQDDRIKAVFVFNPITSQIFGDKGLEKIKIPTMFVAGSNDVVTPALIEQICPFTKLTNRDRYLASIEGGTHLYIANNGNNSSFNIPGLFNPNPNVARRYLKAFSLAFTKTYIANEPTYRDYLNTVYAESIAKSELKLQIAESFNTTQVCPINPVKR